MSFSNVKAWEIQTFLHVHVFLFDYALTQFVPNVRVCMFWDFEIILQITFCTQRTLLIRSCPNKQFASLICKQVSKPWYHCEYTFIQTVYDVCCLIHNFTINLPGIMRNSNSLISLRNSNLSGNLWLSKSLYQTLFKFSSGCGWIAESANSRSLSGLICTWTKFALFVCRHIEWVIIVFLTPLFSFLIVIACFNSLSCLALLMWWVISCTMNVFPKGHDTQGNFLQATWRQCFYLINVHYCTFYLPQKLKNI